MAPPPSQTPASAPHASNSRRRAPNWDEFYKNGLPKEVIVIEDSPEPVVVAARTVAAAASSAAGGHLEPPSSAKKRKRDEAAYADARPRVPLAHAPNTAAAAAAAAEVVYYDGDPNAARRKRARRPADVKREVDGGESLPMPYKAPQPPIQKSGDVTVRVVREVSFCRRGRVATTRVAPPNSGMVVSHRVFCSCQS
jgi:dual-specificity kinase